MPNPVTTNAQGSTVLQVSMQDILSIAGTEENGVNTATEFFIIKWSGYANTTDCRGATDGTNTVPVRSNLHPYDPTLDVRRVEIRPAENNSHTIFQARIEYSDDETTPLNPLDTVPDIQWDVGEDGKVPYFLDNDTAGPKPCVNKAGERFSDFLQRYEGTVTATFTTNVPLTGSYTGPGGTRTAYNVSNTINYCAGGSNQSTPAINSDTFTFDGQLIGIGQARARGCSCGGIQTQNGVKYRVQKWSLAFKSTWLDIIDNRGFNALKTIDGNNVLMEISKGTPPVKPDSPWPLNQYGQALPNVTDPPLQLTFYPYRQLPFTPLGFT